MSEISLSMLGPWGVRMPADQFGEIQDAIDDAEGTGVITWITRDGKRVAAIVPVDVAEAAGEGK